MSELMRGHVRGDRKIGVCFEGREEELLAADENYGLEEEVKVGRVSRVHY